MALLEVDRVTVRYKSLTAIQDTALRAEAGEILGFIGADGAGRFEGEVRFEGVTYHSPKEAEGIKQRIGLMSQEIGLFMAAVSRSMLQVAYLTILIMIPLILLGGT